MKSAVFRYGLLLTGILAISALQGQTVVYTFDSDTSLEGWVSNDKGRWAITNSGVIAGTASLQHAFDNTQAGNDFIFHPFPFILNFTDTLVWQFKVRHGYLPSSANRWLFYLSSGGASDCQACTESALAVGVNLTGSNDGLHLYQIDTSGVHALTQGIFNWENNIGTSTGQVKVVRLPNGMYQLWAASSSSSQLQLCETVQSTFIPAACYFGISYTYSSSQDRKLWIDDISISTKPLQNVRFRVDTFYFVSSHRLLVHFNKPINPATINGNINFSPAISNINFDVGCQQVVISFPDDTESISGRLLLGQVRAWDGEVLADTAVPVSFIKTQAFDVVFSELMIDPTPAQGLPAFEYIECYNRSNHNILMSKWSLSNGSSSVVLPDILLPTGEYLLLVAKDARGAFDMIKHVSYCLPSSFLNNEKGSLWLFNDKGEIMSYGQYRNSYIDEKYKRDGGWSLEIIDADNPCGGSDNWAVSRSLLGGTPGFPNSVAGKNPDNQRPYLCQLALPNDTTCILFFNEPLHPRSLSPDNYMISSLSHPVRVGFYQNEGRAIELNFDSYLQDNMSHSIALSREIADCVTNPVVDTLPQIQLPQAPDSGEVVINEVLFETDDTLVEFIEIYNTTDKFLDAGSLFFCRTDTTTGVVEACTQPLPKGLLIAPNAYLAITNDADKLLKSYATPVSQAVFTWGQLFTLPNQGASLELRRGDDKIIDRVYYSPKLHFPLLLQTRGVSLERINPLVSGVDPGNWHSAAAAVGYATPGYKNSQAITVRKTNDRWLQLRNTTFSPNNDGVDDILVMDIISPEPAAMVTLSLYSADGRWLRHIAYQQYIGNETTFTWDGTVNGRLLPPGIYIIYARLMSSKRILGELKKTCTLVY